MGVSVQAEDFDLGAELAALRAGRSDIGALVSFSGLVRDMPGGGGGLTLEHYPGMTEKALAAIEAEACARWDLQASRIIHRYGALAPGAQIVMVAAASRHRHAAFEATSYMMDYLKSRAPFWKKEGASWVDAREADEAALARWTREA
ncbi:molybdenum cofactor biosynthesis protein MoaE [Abyssibius alkaniclasticus]|uniref:molybdenum cofactor biosynthesis protein MoaE n=1 Tax=Abyssibius alkaniclasticus TaxID=2881234 RepID=UPI0023648F76|nr:molybdenum cofactor biosynthesis protein MoaE [Abyssibius alkaniclasticus]UPH71684.1 molybdenum cofactor biosynthesis protein MoaE [Abyssibius alkaniclasticus]